jgi:hypothetical protein
MKRLGTALFVLLMVAEPSFCKGAQGHVFGVVRYAVVGCEGHAS